MKKIILLLSACFIMLSCSKDDGKSDKYRAEITIMTLSGIPIPNATVKLYVPVDGSNEFIAGTDEDGKVSFEVKAKAYYDVKTWKGTWRGCGYVEFKKGENVQQIVYIREYADPLNTCFD